MEPKDINGKGWHLLLAKDKKGPALAKPHYLQPLVCPDDSLD